MISIYGDESSSAEFATYGLLAISDADLPALAIAVKRAKALLKSNGDEPLHSKVLFHSGLRGKSSFKHASIADVEKACAFVIAQVSMFQIGFYFGRVDRRTAPKKLYVPLTNSKNSSEVLLATLELELSHLQWNAYGAAATRACKTLREPPYRVVVDHNKTIIRWFNESRQAGRLVELMWMDSTLPKWPTPILANDTDHPGLQVVDILTYYATKQFTDPRFVMPFDSIRAKTHFMLHVFEPDVCRPYVAHRVSLLSPFPKKPNPDRMGTGSAGQLHHGQVTSQRRTKAMDIKRNGTQPSGKGPAEWFTGTVRIDPLFKAPDPARVSGASVTFEPGARTAWHTHPLGQTLIVTAGSGLAQREGGPVEQIQPGDVVWFAPGEKHWHGATPTIAMTHIAIAEALDGKVVDWMEHVSDAQYRT